MAYSHLTYEECLRRYPRLVAQIMRVGVFSDGEAACAIRDYRDGVAALHGVSPFDGETHFDLPELHRFGEMMLRLGGGEAVAHYGGPEVLISHAIAWRHR